MEHAVMLHVGDGGEQHGLAAEFPDRLEGMRDRLHAWYNDADANFLQPKYGRERWRPQLPRCSTAFQTNT
jgi:hypothetical protein